MAYMEKKVTALYLNVLDRVPMAEIARGTSRSYPTLQAYKYGHRRITEDAARELAEFLRNRAAEFTDAADQLEAALAEEGGGNG